MNDWNFEGMVSVDKCVALRVREKLKENQRICKAGGKAGGKAVSLFVLEVISLS